MSPQRTLWSDLRSIDKAIVPRLAALYSGLRRAAQDVPTTVRGEGGPKRALDRLDKRYAGRGALALVRDVPQIGIAALTVLLIVAAITIAARSGDDSSAGGLDLPAVSGPNGLTVGPVKGDTIADYLADARAELTSIAQQTPREQTYAIADFEKSLTPDAAALAVPGVEVLQVFLQVKGADATQYFPSADAEFVAKVLKDPLQVMGLPSGAGPVFEGVAAALLAQATDNQTFADSIPADAVQQDLEQKAEHLADARRFRAAAGALRQRCACIYAIVIKAEARTLANIANSGKVRVIDPALTGVAYERLRWVPLPPNIKDGERFPAAGHK